MNIKLMLMQTLICFNWFLSTVIFVRCIISWFPVNRDNSIIRFIYNVTEPILGPIRRLLEKSPLGGGLMIDFSPIIAYILLEVILQILLRVIAAF